MWKEVMRDDTVQAIELVFSGTRELVSETVRLGPPSPGELLITNRYSVISPGTELALYTGTHVGFGDPDIPWAQYPLRPGYSSVGVVSRATERSEGGEPSDTASSRVSRPAVGDTVLHYRPHASHVVLDPSESMCLPVPAERPERFLFVRFAQIAYTAYAASHVEPRRVLVLGAGIVGNLCAQIFAQRGSRVAVADLLSSRLEVAERCGLQHTVGDRELAAQTARVRELLGEPDIVVEATGVPGLVPRALELVRSGGEVILLGSSRGEVSLNVYKLIHRKATMVTGAHEGRIPARAPQGELSHETIALEMRDDIAGDRIQVDPLVTSVVPAREAASAYTSLEEHPEEELGIILDWEQQP
jgi:2-desacetyl-2-hydroxyethyl bacteriochlorophyllide A dehydrogenase